MRLEPFTRALCLVACCLVASSVGAQISDTVERLEQHTGFSALKSDIGREPDRSEAGGACGGIVIHDWIKEKVRVITLGQSVQIVSELDADAKP